MKIRNKILIYFSSTVIALTAVSFVVVYLLFAAHREEEFQQHQSEKITTTIRMLAEYKEKSEELASLMDEQTLHDFYDEKLLIYDGQKDLIFSSVDSLPIRDARHILQQLSPAIRWVETKEEAYDLVGVYTEYNERSYYAISKAFDSLGHSKMIFLRNVLIVMFFLISVVVVVVSLYLSNKITKPITLLAEGLNSYDLSREKVKELSADTTSFELLYLTRRFNELLNRTNKAFEFQKHTIHHISHELKTPIAVLVSELERLSGSQNLPEIKHGLAEQAEKAKMLGEVIQVLLEISKIESGQIILKRATRMDEVLFDLIDELSLIYPKVSFAIHYFPSDIDEKKLTVEVNEVLIRHAFLNLLTNAATYSSDNQVEIRIDGTRPNQLSISFFNNGPTIPEEERHFLFLQYFRGRNSLPHKGFGLGLVLTQKIITHHNGSIRYHAGSEATNVFEVILPITS